MKTRNITFLRQGQARAGEPAGQQANEAGTSTGLLLTTDATGWFGRILLTHQAAVWAGVLFLMVGGFAPARADVFVDPNQIEGTIGWNNPAGPVLNFLTTGGFNTVNDNPWVQSSLSAKEVLNGPHQASAMFFPLSRVSTPYENFSVSTVPITGVEYHITPLMVVVGGPAYQFATKISDPVFPEPAPDVTLDFVECAGLIRIHYRSAANINTPVPVDSSGVYARIPANNNELQAYGGPVQNTGATDHTLIVRGGNTFDLQVSATTSTGSSHFLDYITFSTRSNYTVNVPCDGIVDVTLLIPDFTGSGPTNGALGQIIGRVDMLSEQEHWIGASFTLMAAYNGPQANYRFADVGLQVQPAQNAPCSGVSPFVGQPGCNAAGRFVLKNLLPSDFQPDLNNPPGPRPYGVYSVLTYGLGRRFQTFESPRLDASPFNPMVTVPAGGTVDVGDTFVFNPGWVVGEVYLCAPDEPGKTNSPLRHLFWSSDDDNNQDGIPNDFTFGYTSQIVASGRNELGAGATRSASGGTARTLFDGSFMDSGPDKDHFVGDYRLTLGGLNGEATRWDQSPIWLNFRNLGAGDYLASQIQIRNDHPSFKNVQILPGQTIKNDHRYGMGKVTISFHVTSGQLWSPRIIGSGSFSGTDFEGRSAAYNVNIHYADGLPAAQAAAQPDGSIVMCLPEGLYTFQPTLEVVNGNSSTHNILPSFQQYVGPCSIVSNTPCLQVSVTNLMDCPTNRNIRIAGSVGSCTNVTNISYVLNGVTTSVCDNCGVNPSFAFEVALADCENSLSVVVRDANGETASVSRNVRYDTTPPQFTGCPTGPIDLGCDPASLPDCASALARVTADDACSGLLIPTCSAGAVQVSGNQRSQTFTLDATDACNNTATCAVTYTWTVGCETNSNCCDGCVKDANGQYPASFTVTVLPGWNALVNPLCHGTNNLLIDIIPNAPIEAQIVKWDKVTHVFTQTDVFDPGLGGWVDPNTADPNNTTTLPPGEGFFLFNPGPAYTITYTGCEPQCPPRCPKTNDLWFVGKTGSTQGTSTWESLFGTNCPPLCGSTVRIFNGGIQIYQDYVYLGGNGWSPSTPTWPNGNSVFVFWQPTNCEPCDVICATNKTVECGAAWSFDPPTASCTNTTIAEISTVTNGLCPMVVTRRWVVTDATGHASYCEQEVTVADTVPPVLQGCVDLATNSLTTASGNYVSFTVTALDACEGVLPVHCDPPSGSFFPVGQTLVHCSAVDRCGNSNACTFLVTVRAGCVEIVEETIRCTGTNGLDSYRFCVRNNTDHDLGHLTIVNLPSGVSATPYFLTLNPPLPSGQTRCVTVTLSGLGARTNLCFRLMAHSPDFEECCIVTHCATIVRSAPQIHCPENIAVEAASPATNAVVNFTVQATDGSSNAVPVTCTPASGSMFPCGTTVVNCVVRDACGNTSTCSFTVTVRCHGNDRCDLFIQDTPVYYAGAPDQGNEPDANMIGQPMWTSRGIWVHTDCVQPPGTYLTHQNPRYGQQNCVFAEIKNRGASAVSGAKVELYYANASLGLSWPAQWTLIGTVTLPTIAAGGTHIAQAPWFPPGTGHYCLIARIVSDCDPMTTPEGTDINANVRANNNLAWRNVNVTECLHTPGEKVEVRVRNFEPAPKKLTLVFTVDDDFLPDGGTAILSPGSPLFQRWMDAGAKGSNIEVINGNEIRFTGSPASFEDIPFGENEERVFNLTLRADQPMPVPGTSHVYHAHLLQKIDGAPVGGVAYTIVTRALDTDTDGDGIKDVDDPDDDNDGVLDDDDNNPVGDLDCPPAALTINRTGQEVTITWSGLNYRLQSVRSFGDAWEDVPNASSPYVRTADGDHRFYRLICR